MKANRKETALLKRAIDKWEKDALISKEQAEALGNSIEKSRFDWQSLSFYAFVFAIASITISGVALLADKWLMAMLEKIVDASEGYKAVFFSIVSAGLFYFGARASYQDLSKVYSYKALNLLGVFTTAVALVYVNIAIFGTHGKLTPILLAAVLVYGTLGFLLRSQLIWVAGLASLFILFGAETGYQVGWKNHFWGMNLIVRFIPFSLFLLILCYSLRQVRLLRPFYEITFAFCLISLLCASWAASIFGNHISFADWSAVSQADVLPWMVVFLAIAVICMWLGKKYNKNLMRDMGIVSIIVNLYSRYFEFGWDLFHPALFFALLGFSFWIIGKKAESIWAIGKK